MLLILLVVLAVLGTGIVVSNVRSRKALPKASPPPKALQSGTGDLVERGVNDLRVNDVLTMGDKDFLTEGLLAYDEDGHRWTGARIVDNQTVYWLVNGIERVSSKAQRLLTQDLETQISGYPPEALVIGDVRFVLDKRGTASVQLFGDVGALSELKKGRPEGHTERCRWWLYSAPGDDTMIIEQWGSDFRVLRGKRVGDGIIELIPGS